MKADHDKDAGKNRTAQLNSTKSGDVAGDWKKSTRYYDLNLIGSPGRKHFGGAFTPLTSSTVPYSPIVINEIGFGPTTGGGDWFELKNVDATAAKSIENYQLSQVTDTDTRVVSFHGKKWTIPAGGVLLVISGDPASDSHPIAAGVNIAQAAEDRILSGVTSMYAVIPGFEIKDGESLLILRNNHEDNKLKTANNLIDVTGGKSITNTTPTRATNLWPLIRTGAAHGEVINTGGTKNKVFSANTVYKRNKAGAGTVAETWVSVGYTGIGYKREADNSAANGGTPGYANDASKEFNAKATNADGTANTAYVEAPVTISEIMYAAGQNLPQWVELYNSSMTQGVQLNEWQLKLENADDVSIRTPAVTVKLKGKVIPPNQTVLIAASAGRNSGDFSDARVFDLWTNGLVDPGKLEIDKEETTRRQFTFLSQTAFKITLMDKAGEIVDVAGNMGADPAWELPMGEDDRSSLIRRYDDGVERDGTMLGDGTAGSAGWVLASDSPLGGAQQDTYYGSREDQGTPGYRAGGALPVSLSKFRPERLESGAVVVRWITESELNNAGFNILRSETRDGEFTKLNTKLIAGQGTISERTVYEYADTSAKPNVVYYYQIQDVSLDGKVQTLRQSRLKGNVSADGKLTTTWGELKLQD